MVIPPVSWSAVMITRVCPSLSANLRASLTALSKSITSVTVYFHVVVVAAPVYLCAFHHQEEAFFRFGGQEIYRLTRGGRQKVTASVHYWLDVLVGGNNAYAFC